MDRIKSLIRDVPNFPKEGIIFKDITPILKDVEGFLFTINHFVERYRGMKIDAVAAIESRGFILGSAIAHDIHAGFIPIRKAGKLPYKSIKESYDLEYGSSTIEIHEDAIKAGERILLIDDLLATGGTARASANLINRLGGNIVEIAFLVELLFLNGRNNLSNYSVYSAIQF